MKNYIFLLQTLVCFFSFFGFERIVSQNLSVQMSVLFGASVIVFLWLTCFWAYFAKGKDMLNRKGKA